MNAPLDGYTALLGRRAVLRLGAVGAGALLLGACGSSDSDSGGVRVVSPDDAASVQDNPPAGLQIIDVRTPEEFADGHLEGAQMIDFYEGDFAARISELDRSQPYLVYCRSGNRSGQTRELMEDLGFTDVRDLDGGAVAWAAAGHDLVTP